MTLVELEYPKDERIEGDDRYAKFACEPLPPGYGTTLGNSLRRVLLSSLPGAAITAARVRGVAHEFSTIPGVKEDVVQIVLNLKQIRLRSFSNEPVTLTIEKEGPGVATAADIATTSPEEAVAQGSNILVQQFSLFAGLTKTQTAIAAPDRTNGSALPSAIADMPIEDLDLPQRAFNSLKRHGITKVGQLLQTPDEELLRMRNFGKKSLDEIKERLAARGLIELPPRDETEAETAAVEESPENGEEEQPAGTEEEQG